MLLSDVTPFNFQTLLPNVSQTTDKQVFLNTCSFLTPLHWLVPALNEFLENLPGTVYENLELRSADRKSSSIRKHRNREETSVRRQDLKVQPQFVGPFNGAALGSSHNNFSGFPFLTPRS